MRRGHIIREGHKRSNLAHNINSIRYRGGGHTTPHHTTPFAPLCSPHLVQRSSPSPPLLAATKYPILESQRGRRSDHGVPSPVRNERVVQSVVRIGVHPIRPVPHAQVIAELQPDVRLADGHERHRHAGIEQVTPPIRILEDLLLTEGSSERSRQHEERRRRRRPRPGGVPAMAASRLDDATSAMMGGTMARRKRRHPSSKKKRRR